MQQSTQSRGWWVPEIESKISNMRGLQKQPAEDPSKIHGGIHGYQGAKNPFGGLRQLEWRKGFSPFLFLK